MPEVRLIDANAMKAEVELLDAESNNRIYKCAMEDMLRFFIDFIDKQPTIEPEVRHGRWETIDPSFAHVYCSECGAAADKYLAKRYKGCPFCLCVMDATDTNDGKGGADNA